MGRLFILVMLTSLARNSGWSSLLALGIVLLCFAVKTKRKQISELAKTILLGVAVALSLIAFVYPNIGVAGNGGLTSTLSVPIQQISRVVAYNGNISPEEAELIQELMPLEQIQESYDATISDPIKFHIDSKKIEDNLSAYVKLWIQLGFKNPKLYWDAFLELTMHYWYLDSTVWVYDSRIFDNPYGVTRTALLLPDVDAAHALHVILPFTKLYTSSIILWVTIIVFGFLSITRNRLGMILLVTVLSVFIGLLFTSPVALFRYTYGAAVCLPLVVSIPFIDSQACRFSKQE